MLDVGGLLMLKLFATTLIFAVPAAFAQGFHTLGLITPNAKGPGIHSDGTGGHSTTTPSKAVRFQGI
jgi:hypothetical protein